MEKNRPSRNPITAFLGVTGIVALAAYVNILPPDTGIALLGFFALCIMTLFFLGMYIIGNLRHTIVLTCSIMLYLILRYMGLRHPLYPILLVASVIALEYVWKDHEQS